MSGPPMCSAKLKERGDRGPVRHLRERLKMRELLGSVLILGGMAIWLVSLIGIIRPLPRLWLPTRKRAGLLFGASFLICILGGAVLPPPTPEQLAARKEREEKAALERKEQEDKEALEAQKQLAAQREQREKALLEEQKWRDSFELANAFLDMKQKAPRKSRRNGT